MDSILPYSATSRPPERNKWLTYAMNIKPRPRSKSVDPEMAVAGSKYNADSYCKKPHRNRSQFYADLYTKYPKAFQRRTSDASLSSRSSTPTRPSRQLFSSQLHVHFDNDPDNASVYSEMRPSLNTWMNQEDNRDCLTSPTPSMMSDLSVKQRLHATSDTLHYLLHNKLSSERSRRYRNDVYLDRQPYQASPNKIPERYSKDVDQIQLLEQELQWKEKQLEKYRRKLEYDTSVLDDNHSINTHYNTALNWNSESPPDSAIDIDTLSLQSHVSMDTISVVANEIDIDDIGNFQSLEDEICTAPSSFLPTHTDLLDAENRETDRTSLYHSEIPGRSDITLTHKDSDVDSGIVQSARGHITVTDMELLSCQLDDSPCYRKSDEVCKRREHEFKPREAAVNLKSHTPKPKPKPLKADHSLRILIPSDENNEDDDDSIKQELLRAQISRDLRKLPEFHASGSSLIEGLEDVDDSDPRLGIPEMKGNEQEVAARYQMRRSPSPYFLGKSKFSIKSRPKSAPLFGIENKMQYVNISAKDRDECLKIPNENGIKMLDQENISTNEERLDYKESVSNEISAHECDNMPLFSNEEMKEKPRNSTRTLSLSSNSSLSDTSCNSLILTPSQQTSVNYNSEVNQNSSFSQPVIDRDNYKSLSSLPLSSNVNEDLDFVSPKKGRYSPSEDLLVLSGNENVDIHVQQYNRESNMFYNSEKETVQELQARKEYKVPTHSENEMVLEHQNRGDNNVVFDPESETMLDDQIRESNMFVDSESKMALEHQIRGDNNVFSDSEKEMVLGDQTGGSNNSFVDSNNENIGQVRKKREDSHTADVNNFVQYNQVKDVMGSVQSESIECENLDKNMEVNLSRVMEEFEVSETETISSDESDVNEQGKYDGKLIPKKSTSPDKNDGSYVKLTPFEYAVVGLEDNNSANGVSGDGISDVKPTPYEAAVNLDGNGINVEEIIDSDSDNIFSAKRVLLNKPRKQYELTSNKKDVEERLSDPKGQIMHQVQIERSDTNLNDSDGFRYENRNVNNNVTSNNFVEIPLAEYKNDSSSSSSDIKEVDISHVTSELPVNAGKSNHMTYQKKIELPANTCDVDDMEVHMTKELPNNHGKIEDKIVSCDTDENEACISANKSNLAKSKGLSASKQSLSDKMGNLKKSAKGKFKAIRKAVSMDRGLNKASFESEQSPSPPAPGKKVKMPKIKKAISLKNLFSKKKSKHGSVEFLDHMSPYMTSSSDVDFHSVEGPYTTQPSSSNLSGHHQRNRSIGKLHQFCADGTQIIELNRPPQGPLGIYIARGNQHFQHGIFISRFSEPKKSFAGVVSVGDEILEINGKSVKDLTLDEVYNIMAAKTCLVMKILPLLARKDV